MLSVKVPYDAHVSFPIPKKPTFDSAADPMDLKALLQLIGVDPEAVHGSDVHSPAVATAAAAPEDVQPEDVQNKKAPTQVRNRGVLHDRIQDKSSHAAIKFSSAKFSSAIGSMEPPPAPQVALSPRAGQAWKTLLDETTRGMRCVHSLIRTRHPALSVASVQSEGATAETAKKFGDHNLKQLIDVPKASFVAFLMATVGDDSTGADVLGTMSDLIAKIEKSNLDIERKKQQESEEAARRAQTKSKQLGTANTVIGCVLAAIALAFVAWTGIGALAVGLVVAAMVGSFVIGGFVGGGGGGKFDLMKALNALSAITLIACCFCPVGWAIRGILALIEVAANLTSAGINYEIAEAHIEASMIENIVKMYDLFIKTFQMDKKQVDDVIQKLMESHDDMVQKAMAILADKHVASLKGIARMA